MEPEVALVTAGVEYDVLGIGYEDISEADRAETVALHPRPDCKRRILGSPERPPAFPRPSPSSPFFLVRRHVPAQDEKIVHRVSLPFRPPFGPHDPRLRALLAPSGTGSQLSAGQKIVSSASPLRSEEALPRRG